MNNDQAAAYAAKYDRKTNAELARRNDLAVETPKAFALTIDAKDLRDLWIPCERNESAALDYMDEATDKALGKPRYKPLHQARMALFFQWRETVKFIHRQGGLLHVGCTGALA